MILKFIQDNNDAVLLYLKNPPLIPKKEVGDKVWYTASNYKYAMAVEVTVIDVRTYPDYDVYILKGPTGVHWLWRRGSNKTGSLLETPHILFETQEEAVSYALTYNVYRDLIYRNTLPHDIPANPIQLRSL